MWKLLTGRKWTNRGPGLRSEEPSVTVRSQARANTEQQSQTRVSIHGPSQQFQIDGEREVVSGPPDSEKRLVTMDLSLQKQPSMQGSSLTEHETTDEPRGVREQCRVTVDPSPRNSTADQFFTWPPMQESPQTSERLLAMSHPSPSPQTNAAQHSQIDSVRRATPELELSEEPPAIVNTEELGADDVVIAVMGPTGSGKSTFVRLASGHGVEGIGHELVSFTKEVLAIRFRDQESGRYVVLVDTPGFDGTYKSDLEILNMISDWLNSSYKKEKLLSGILYLHRISDNRMAGTPLKNLRAFQKLCGKDALDKVYLTTTMWDEVEQSIGEKRLKELTSEYWNSMVIQGAQIARSRNDDNSVKDIIRHIVSHDAVRKAVLLQEEMANLNKELEETEAGQELCSQIEKLVGRQMVLLQKIDMGRKVPSDVRMLANLQEEYDELRLQVDEKLRQMQQLKLSWLHNLLRFGPRRRIATVHSLPQTPAGQQSPIDVAHPETARVSEEPMAISTDDLEPDDIVIAVMGLTGSGKSTFIRLASGHENSGVGHDLTRCTKDVLAVRFLPKENSQHVVLVDTPGFDDAFESDSEIMDKITEWLRASYKKGKLLSGILYLHRISDNRMGNTPLRNLRAFRKLCGKGALDRVYLTTTMWDEVDPATGKRRLEELKTKYWKPMIAQGAQVACCRNDDDSARKIIQQVVSQEAGRKAAQLQVDLVDLRKVFKTTESRRELYSRLERLVERQTLLLQKIDRERSMAADANLLEEFQKEYNDLGAQINDKLLQIQEFRLSWLEYLLRFFSRNQE